MKSVAALVVVNTLLVSAPVGSPDCGVQGLTLSKRIFGGLFGRSKNNVGSDMNQSLVNNQDQNEDLEFYQGQENIQNNRNVDSPVADGTPSEQGAEKEQALENEKQYNKMVLDKLSGRGLGVKPESGSRKRPAIKIVLGDTSHTSKFVLFEDSPIKSKKERASMMVTDVKNVWSFPAAGRDQDEARIILSGNDGQKLDFVWNLSPETTKKVLAALKAIVQDIDDVMSANDIEDQ